MPKIMYVKYIAILFLLLSCNTEKPTQFSQEALQDTFITLDGTALPFQDILAQYKGKTVLIDVWASWCRDCIKGIPKVKKLQEEHSEVAYVFLSLDKTDSSWKNGIKKYQLSGDHYYMKSGWKGAFGKFLDLDWIPRYLVLDKEGNIKLFKAIKADDPKIAEAFN